MTGEITHVWVVNRTEEVDPLYVFVDEDQAREFAARYPDAVAGEEVVMNRSAGSQFLIDTYEPDDDAEHEPDDHSSRKEDARDDADSLTRMLERALADAKALDEIAYMLCDPQWGVGMLEDAAEIVRRTGRSVQNLPGDAPTWDRH